VFETNANKDVSKSYASEDVPVMIASKDASATIAI
jgi:hypothetical protein